MLNISINFQDPTDGRFMMQQYSDAQIKSTVYYKVDRHSTKQS